VLIESVFYSKTTHQASRTVLETDAGRVLSAVIGELVAKYQWNFIELPVPIDNTER
jgi:hypothetical protein